MGDEYVPGQDYWGADTGGMDAFNRISRYTPNKGSSSSIGHDVPVLDNNYNWPYAFGNRYPSRPVAPPPGKSTTGWWGKTFENFGGKDGWGGTAIAAGKLGFDALLGMKNYKLAKDELALNKQAYSDQHRLTKRNFNAQVDAFINAQNVVDANAEALGFKLPKSSLPDNLQLA